MIFFKLKNLTENKLRMYLLTTYTSSDTNCVHIQIKNNFYFLTNNTIAIQHYSNIVQQIQYYKCIIL